MMRVKTLGPCFLLAFTLGGVAAAQQATTTYQTPAQILVDIADAPPTPAVSLSPNRQWMLLLTSPSMPSIADLAEPELRIGGTRIATRISGRSRQTPYRGATLLKIADRSTVAVQGLPSSSKIDDVRWSPDGRWIAFTHTRDDGVEAWVIEVASAVARRLTAAPLNTVLVSGPVWMSDSRTVLLALVPDDRSAEPQASSIPQGPTIQQNVDKTAPVRTYRDLLDNLQDELLFEHYATAQLVRVDVDGTVASLGAPGIIGDISPSPDGRYVLVERVHRPFSYLVPWSRFPTRIEVVDMSGATVHLLADLPLREEIPVASGSVPRGPRSVNWRADAPATLYWVEALDGGDGDASAAERDRLYLLPAPFSGDPQPLATLGFRYSGITWGADDLALVRESWRRTRQVRTWRIRPGDPNAAPELLFDRVTENRYGDPGDFVTRPNQWGRSVLHVGPDGRTLFLTGSGASPEGDRPFVDRFDLRTGTTERLFRSEAPYYESVIHLLDDRGRRALTRRESPDQAPNYYLRDFGSGRLRQVTSFDNPTPQLEDMTKELVRYERADGVGLSGTLYLPSGYDAQRDGPLPMLVWAYPREFKTVDGASQVSGSPYRFTRLSGLSPSIWVALGYAVLDGATMPIIGEGETQPNDAYVEQLVASAEAAVAEMERRGVAERGRIGVGGHSYGAFMTANLLTHSDLFAAGVARSGAYNRTLTPFGFQNEERTFWEAPDVYFAMSPFMNVEKIDEPILLIHGEADNNSGTFPIQSERYYHALKGSGKVARLVMLPHESHGYRARESILHVLWETQQWLETYVKKGTPRQKQVSSQP